MENNLQNPAPEEQFTTSTGADETTSVPAPGQPAEEHMGNVNDDAAQDASNAYARMSRKELLETFGEMLNSTATETAERLRQEAENIKTAFYKLLWQERKNIAPAVENIKENAAATEKTMQQMVEAVTDELETQFKELYNAYKQKRAAVAQQIEKDKEENLAKKLAIIEELKALLEKQEDLTQTFPAFRALQQHWRETGPVPAAHTKDVWENYHHQVELFYDYVKINNELRDLDLKKNLEVKTTLSEKAEELLLEPSVINAFNKLQQLHDQWREIGPVARELREQVWERFKNATTAINKKHQEYFEQQKEEQLKNLQAKIALCEKAEEIAATEAKTNGEWNALSKELDEMLKIWKTVGYATKKENTKVYERFRAACDKFYNAKREYYGQFRDEMQQNLKLKTLLIEQAEALKNSEDWKKVTDKFISLQKQWKEIGPVARRQSEAVWSQFRTACDEFFNRKEKHFSTIDVQYDENLRLKEAIVQEIESFVPGGNAKENLNALKDFQRRWTEIGYVPMKEKERIQNAYRTAIDKQFAALRISDTEKKLIRFKNRIEDIQQTGKADRIIRSERDKLVQQLRQLESDIALWENNIGFFAKSKNADMLIADVNKKIAVAKEEIKTVEEKIKLIDKQYE